MRITKVQLKRIIKEELKRALNLNENKLLDGQELPQVRLVAADNTLKVPRGSTIVVTAGFGFQARDKFQIHIVKRGPKFDNINQMISTGITGEQYYMTEDEILKISQPDSLDKYLA